MNKNNFHCGYVALIGRPNVGKSTLLNAVLGKKLSITSSKPQTTRHRLLGIKTLDNAQIVFVDTPGLHRNAEKAINRYMNRAATSSLHDVDLVLFMIDARKVTAQDKWILQQISTLGKKTILVLNKIDLVKQKETLLPLIDELKSLYSFQSILPISAEKRENILDLEQEIVKNLPTDSHAYFPDDQITDRSPQFIASEMVRESLMRHLGQELPYALTVTIDAFEDEPDIIRIAATIWVERAGQKPIVIGQNGERLKEIGQKSRFSLESYFSKKVFLKLWVKVKENWSDDGNLLNQFGYRDD